MSTNNLKKRNVAMSTSILTFTAFVWGMGFVAQRSGMKHIGPFFFSGARMFMGALTLFIIIAISIAIAKAKGRTTSSAPFLRLVKAGAICGFVLFFGGNFQQVGMVFTTASKSGFLTALYIVLVPILGIFLKHKTHWNTWVSVLISGVGLYFLCVTENLHIQIGDLIVLIGSLGWATHVMVIDHYVSELKQSDMLKLCALQFLFASIFAFICAPLFDKFFVAEKLTLVAIESAIIPLLYAGIASTGIGFTLQAVGQRYANPSEAAIIMSLEAVFAVIGGVIILHEKMSGREIIGCILMFAAVILAQLPIGSKQDKTEQGKAEQDEIEQDKAERTDSTS